MEGLNVVDANSIKKREATHTEAEIYQQPAVWKEIWESVDLEGARTFLQSIYNKHETGRVIFTGAGTSAFIGDMLVPELQSTNFSIESIPTTDIVSNPMNYLVPAIPTILVSFGRSGNSPESLAAMKLAEDLVSSIYHIVITCNKEGEMANSTQGNQNSKLLQLPSKTHDKGFAMTSSFSGMGLTAYAVFSQNKLTSHVIDTLASSAELFLRKADEIVGTIIEQEIERIVYLGSGTLARGAREAALKMLELTAGKVVATFDSSLGFRHGPKSILNKKTLVVAFLSSNPHTRKYDIDIVKELSNDPGVRVVALSEKQDEAVINVVDHYIAVNDEGASLDNDFLLGLVYITFAQMIALTKSFQLAIQPDNPSPDGRVNRVVQGVTIYDFEK